jgi:hypothetical protein
VAFGGENSDLNAQDFMAMTTIQALVENFTLEGKSDTAPMEKKIVGLIEELDKYLKK